MSEIYRMAPKRPHRKINKSYQNLPINRNFGVEWSEGQTLIIL